MAFKLGVEIVGDASSLFKAFRQSSTAAKRFQNDLSKTAKGGAVFGGLSRAVGFATAGLGVAGLAGAAHAAFDEMADAQKATAQTAAVLKSTGNAAGVTARQVDDLAKSISSYSGQDDEAVQAGENMLLTFTKIRDVAGANNDIFTQATKVTADLAQAMGIDMTRAALQVGKALNDPARGYARLQRIGVAFTKTQVAQIKAFSKAGNVMAAQRVILAELNKEFGGSAEAFGETLPGKIAILQETLRNLGGVIAEQLAPEIEKVVDRMTRWITNTANQQRVIDAFKTAGQLLATVLRTLKGVLDTLNTVTGSTIGTLKLLLAAFLAFKTARIALMFAEIATGIGAVGTASTVASVKATALVGALNLMAGPVGLIAAAGTGLLVLERNAIAAADGVAKIQAQTFEKGGHLETTLVPALAKQIAALKAAGKTSAQIITELRAKLGGSLKADDLIAEAFAFGSGASPELTARIKAQMAAAGDTVVKAAKDVLPKIKAKAATAKQRNAWFDALIGRETGQVQDIPSPGGQLVALQKIAGEIRARMAVTNDVTRLLKLEDDLRDNVRAQRAARDAQTQEFMDSLQLGLAKAEATVGFEDDLAALRRINAGIRAQIAVEGETAKLLNDRFNNEQAIKAKEDERRQEKLDWLQFAIEKADATKGVKDNVKAERAYIAALKQEIKTMGLTAARARELWNAQQDLKKALHPKKAAGSGRTAARMWGTGRNPFGTGGAVGGAGATAASGTDALVRRSGGFVVVNQHFNAPTTDRHREARYALNATRAVFDG